MVHWRVIHRLIPRPQHAQPFVHRTSRYHLHFVRFPIRHGLPHFGRKPLRQLEQILLHDFGSRAAACLLENARPSGNRYTGGFLFPAVAFKRQKAMRLDRLAQQFAAAQRDAVVREVEEGQRTVLLQ